MKSYNNQPISYDKSGNPTNYLGKTLKWQGRKLVNADGVAMEYDINGLRVKKGDTLYFWQDNNLIAEKRGNSFIYYYYDESGVCGMNYNGNDYFFRKNVLGDVLAVYDYQGTPLCRYQYDAWGNSYTYDTNGIPITSSSTHVGNINPFRYRGYYWDTELLLYYLQSRYYDPALGRFISPDDTSYLNTESVFGLNLYAYCNNNPVMYTDPNGTIAQWLVGLIVGTIAGLAGQFVSDLINGEWSSWQNYLGAAVGGAVSGLLVATGFDIIGSAMVGTLVADATTYGLNLISGQETRSFLEFGNDLIEDLALSGIFAVGGSIFSSIFAKNAGKAMLSNVLQQTSKYTFVIFLKELGSNFKDSVIENLFDYIYYKIKDFFARYFVV